MREMLEPIFGTGGAVIAQFIITLAVVLALVAVVVWLVRRYAAGGLGITVRGRLPRLAVVDAVAIDNRRKLVLVRRDHVEHLLLIGGPTDVLVEPGILRARTVAQRGSAAQAQAAARQPTAPPQPVAGPLVAEMPAPRAPVAEPPAEPPIPFPPRRAERPIARRELPRQPVPVADNPPPRRASPSPRTSTADLAAAEEARITPFVVPSRLGLAPVPDEDAPAYPVAEPTPVVTMEEETLVEAPSAESRPFETPPRSEPEAGESETADSPITAADEPPAPGEDSGSTAARVNDLEREMARLLGEISNRYSS